MIIKIPIYVEVEGLKDQEHLPILIKGLSHHYTKLLEKTSYSMINRRVIPDLDAELLSALDYKLLTKEKVLEIMRTKK